MLVNSIQPGPRPYLAERYQQLRGAKFKRALKRRAKRQRLQPEFLLKAISALLDGTPVSTFDKPTQQALAAVVKNAEGDVIEGDPNEIKRQRDVWTFARNMGSDDPNWQLVATGE